MSATNYTLIQAKADYPPQLRRAGVIELGSRFGFTVKTMRTLIEGPEAIIKGHTFGNQKRSYFHRDEILETLFPRSTKPKS